MEILVPCFLFTFLGNEIVLFFLEGVIFRLTEPAVLLVIGTEIMRVQVCAEAISGKTPKTAEPLPVIRAERAPLFLSSCTA